MHDVCSSLLKYSTARAPCEAYTRKCWTYTVPYKDMKRDRLFPFHQHSVTNEPYLGT